MSDEATPGTQPTRVTRSAPGGGGDGDGFAGLPTGRGGGTKVQAGSKMPSGMGALVGGLQQMVEGARGERAYREFTLTKKILGMDYETRGFGAEHMTFAIVELTPEEEAKAVSLAGQGFKVQESFAEMVKASIYLIGGQRPNYDQKGAWLAAIGPKCRKQVERCFNDVNGLEEREGEEILATAKSGRA